MIWQDILLTIISVVFIFALIPQVYHGYKTKKALIVYTTSLPNAIGMYLVSFIYFTLSLYSSSVLGFVTATLWLSLFIQRIVYSKKF